MPGILARRIVSAIVLVPLSVWIVAAAPVALFRILVVGLAAAAAWELVRMFARAGRAASPGLAATAGAAVAASFAVPGAPIPVLALIVAVVLGMAIWRPGLPSIESTLLTGLAVLYVGWLLGHAVLLQALPGGRGLVLFLLAVTWAGETAAYAVGSLMGRHKLAPRVSPGKTVEGAIAQVIASVIVALALRELGPGWTALPAAAAGLVLGLVGQVGDLAESVLKRSAGAKDAGALIPGHGGLLDRLDGLLFNTPALFYYTTVLGGRA